MKKTATITGKRQITIPVKLYKAAGLDRNKKILISQDADSLTITSAANLVDKLAGSLKIPASWKGKDIDKIINQSKKEYLEQRKQK